MLYQLMKTPILKLKSSAPWVLLASSLILLAIVWTNSGFDSLSFDTDLGRDLMQISNIQKGEVVWLGPWLGPGLHASSAYYYLYYPSIVLFGGKIAGMVWFNLFLGLLAIGYFGYYALKKYGYAGVAGTLVLGLLPLMNDNILHPGNGFSYMYFVLISFTALWFKAPFVIAAFAAGFAIALHPATGFLPAFLLLGWWMRGHKWKDALLGLLAFSLPLAPLIAFEIITKGYIIRSFLSRPSTNGIYLDFSSHNAHQVSHLLGLSLLTLGTFLGITGYQVTRDKGNTKKVWFSLTLFFFFFILFFQNLIWRYLFAIAIMVIFFIVVIFMQRKATTLLLVVVATILFTGSPLFNPLPKTARTIENIESIADTISENNLISRDKKIAIVSALTHNTEVPQADDYHFLLRNRGFTVMNVTEYAQAEQLLYVIEVPGFNWQNWSNWEINSFGNKKLIKVQAFNENVTLVVYDKSE